jgi:hypothetical protein
MERQKRTDESKAELAELTLLRLRGAQDNLLSRRAQMAAYNLRKLEAKRP